MYAGLFYQLIFETSCLHLGKPKHTLEYTYAVMKWLYYDSQGPVEIVDTGLKS